MRYAVEEMYLCDENVEKVLEGAREDMAAVFGYAADSQKVGITGTVELVEIEGPIVIIRLGGRFWHKRSDVVQRVANYLIERIPRSATSRWRTSRNWTTRTSREEARLAGEHCSVSSLVPGPRADDRARRPNVVGGASAKQLSKVPSPPGAAPRRRPQGFPPGSS